MASALVIAILAAAGQGASLALIGRERDEAARQRAQTRHHRYVADIRQAYDLSQNGLGPKALQVLRNYRPTAGQEDVREFAWHDLMRRCHGAVRILRGHEGAVYHAGFSPDGRTLASCGRDGTVRLWDVATGRLLRMLSTPGQATEVNSAKFSPDGHTLVTAGDDGQVRLWEVGTGGLRATIDEHQGEAGADFTPDGRRLLSLGRKDHRLKLWDVATRELVASINATEKDLENAVASPDGKLLATTGGDFPPDNARLSGGTAELLHLPHEAAGVVSSRCGPVPSPIRSFVRWLVVIARAPGGARRSDSGCRRGP